VARRGGSSLGTNGRPKDKSLEDGSLREFALKKGKESFVMGMDGGVSIRATEKGKKSTPN